MERRLTAFSPPPSSRAQAIESEDAISLYNSACVYSHPGEPDPALALLERAISNRRPMRKDWNEKDSDLDGIRHGSRFKKILEQIG